MVSHRQDVPWFAIKSIHFFCSMTTYLKYTEPGVAHFLISAFLGMSHQPHLSHWTLLGMEAWVSQFHHSSMVISGCRMGTWCSLIKYCICNRVKCSLPYPCSKLPLPQEKGQSWNVGYEVLLSNLQQKDRHQSSYCSYLCGMELRMPICFKDQSRHFSISKQVFHWFWCGFFFKQSNSVTLC